MKITYDKTTDAMYIGLKDTPAYKSTKKISDDVMVDYGEDGSIIGVEVLTASKNAILSAATTAIPIDFGPSNK